MQALFLLLYLQYWLFWVADRLFNAVFGSLTQESPYQATADTGAPSQPASARGQTTPDTPSQQIAASTVEGEGRKGSSAAQQVQVEEEQPAQQARAQQAQQAEREAKQAEQETRFELRTAQQAQQEALQAEQETLDSSHQGLEEVRQALLKQPGMLMQAPLLSTIAKSNAHQS